LLLSASSPLIFLRTFALHMFGNRVIDVLRAEQPHQEIEMKALTIDNETRKITAHASGKEAAATPNSTRLSSENTLSTLVANWPMARLVELWNSLPGVTPVNKFKDRTTAIARIWKAIQSLEVAAPAAEPEKPELIAEVTILPQAEPLAEPETAAAAADVAPQGTHVAPEAPAAGSDSRPAASAPVIDTAECDRLLKIAAGTQRAFWSALLNLEQAIGFDIDDPGDLESTTVDELLEHREAKAKRRASLQPKEPRQRRAASEGVRRPRAKTRRPAK
jgi:hypothetical protein